MNQKTNFSDRRNPHWINRSFNLTRLIFLFIAVFSTTTEIVIAQGNLVPLPTSRPNSPLVPAPGFRPDDSQDAVEHSSSPVASQLIRFPESTVAFDPGVRSTKLDIPAPEQTGGSMTVDSTIDSTATMLSNLKSATSEKISGLAASFDSNGSLSDKIKSFSDTSDIGKMLGSLTLVLGLYFSFVWIMRKINPNGNAGLPSEVIEVMGHVPFGPKRNLQLVRLGSKLLLLNNGPEGTQPLGEITDPVEVEYLASLCSGKRKTAAQTITAIQHAAKRLATARTVPEPGPVSAPAASSSTSGNLASILRTLEQSSKQNNAMFEA